MGIPNPMEALAETERQSTLSELLQDEKQTLPAVTVLNIDVKDARGNRYEGTFVYTVPRLNEQIKIGRMKQVYLPMGTPDANVLQLIDMICYLAVTCAAPKGSELPGWFTNMTQLYDTTAPNALYTEAFDYEGRFLGGSAESRGNAEADREASTGGEGRGDSVPVGRKVQPPAKRREVLTGDGA